MSLSSAWSWSAAVAGLFFWGCSAATEHEACPDGICTANGGTGGGSGGGGAGGGGGTGGSAGTGGRAGTGGSGTGGTGGQGNKDAGARDGTTNACVESWLCTPWTTAGATSNAGTRSCTDTNNCGTTANKPAESATLPALDFDFFKCKVGPVFATSCSMLGCHGTDERPLRLYHRGQFRLGTESVNKRSECLADPKLTTPLSQCIGSIECECWMAPKTQSEWRRNYDSARGFGLDAGGKPIARGMEDTSDLIAQPIVGGKAHAGIHMFKSGDPDYLALKMWLSGSKLGQTCQTTD